MEKVKKELVPTELGFQLIDNVDVTLTKPDTTAEMEFALAEIAAGEGSVEKFRQDVYDTIDRNIAYAEAHQFPGYIHRVRGSTSVSRLHHGEMSPLQNGESGEAFFSENEKSILRL